MRCKFCEKDIETKPADICMDCADNLVLLQLITDERDQLRAAIQELNDQGDNSDLWGTLVKELHELRVKIKTADKLAYFCVKAIERNTISGIADTLLDYLKIGSPDGFSDVFQWMVKYEKEMKC